MKLLTLLALLAAALCLPGCASYDRFATGYDRTYSVRYGEFKAGVTLAPIGGLKK